jgi:protease I
MTRKTVVLLVASEGYQPIEYNETKKILEEGGMCVRTASDKPNMAVASDNTTTKVDLTINNIIPDRYDGIFFIGGPGAMDHLDNPTSDKLIKETVKVGKLLGAICITPRILAKAGVLRKKHATGWDGDNELEGVFQKYGVIRKKKDVVVDDNIVTATCPAAAQEFGKAILKLLEGTK